MLNSTGTVGHVMMITPGGLIDISKKEDKTKLEFSFTTRDIQKIPRVLECGQGKRENRAPLCTNVDWKGATQRLKWFKYLK